MKMFRRERCCFFFFQRNSCRDGQFFEFPIFHAARGEKKFNARYSNWSRKSTGHEWYVRLVTIASLWVTLWTNGQWDLEIASFRYNYILKIKEYQWFVGTLDSYTWIYVEGAKNKKKTPKKTWKLDISMYTHNIIYKRETAHQRGISTTPLPHLLMGCSCPRNYFYTVWLASRESNSCLILVHVPHHHGNTRTVPDPVVVGVKMKSVGVIIWLTISNPLFHFFLFKDTSNKPGGNLQFQTCERAMVCPRPHTCIILYIRRID